MIRALKISIPQGVDFADLNLTRNAATGGVGFDWEPIKKVCAASGIDVAEFRDHHEDRVSELLINWYIAHIDQGGSRDPVADDLFIESIHELRTGNASHPAGRA